MIEVLKDLITSGQADEPRFGIEDAIDALKSDDLRDADRHLERAADAAETLATEIARQRDLLAEQMEDDR